MFWRRSYFDPKHCPHAKIRGIYGDEIRVLHGYRLECLDCKTLLKGPVALASVDRDPFCLLETHREVMTKSHEHDWVVKIQTAGSKVVTCSCGAWESMS